MNELRQWKQKQATGALSDRQERRMQFLQAQQDRQRMANQAEQVMQNHYNPQPQQQAPAQAQQQNWTQGFPGPGTDMASQFGQENQGMQQGQFAPQTQGPRVKINDPSTWANHAQPGLLGQYQGQSIDPGFNPGNWQQGQSNPQVDAAFDMMRKRRPGVPYMNLK